MVLSSPVCALPCPLVFDLDGTLIDSLPDLAAAVNRLLVAEGLGAMAEPEVASYVGNGAPVLMARVMAARGIDPARHGEMTGRMVTDYTARSAERTVVYPGVRDALALLAARGHALGLCTNKPILPTQAILAHFGLADLFGAVIGGDSLPQRKPDAAPLHAVVAALGGVSGDGRAIYVGDSVVDADAARNAGLPFVLFTRGYLNGPRDQVFPAATFDDFADLPALIARLTE